MKMNKSRLFAALLAALALSGCAQLPFFESEPRRTPARVEERSQGRGGKAVRVERNERAERIERERAERQAASREQAALREGINLYNDGDFNGAIRRLGANDLANASVRNRVTALKYTAFSYCVTSRPAQCRDAFERALRLDPSFKLASGERGHPLWGPVYDAAKQGR